METKFWQSKNVLGAICVLFTVGLSTCACGVVHLYFALKLAEKSGLSIVTLGSGFDVNSQYPGVYLAFQDNLLTCILYLGFGLILMLEFCAIVIMRRSKDRSLEFMEKLWFCKIAVLFIVTVFIFYVKMVLWTLK